MNGPQSNPLPTDIKVHRRSRVLEIAFDDGARFELPFEYLRVYSPSAEVQGHHGEGAVLQVGKEEVALTDIRQVGNYAVKLFFDDGHRTGLFTWRYLHELGTNHQRYWSDYLRRLEAAGHSRRAPV